MAEGTRQKKGTVKSSSSPPTPSTADLLADFLASNTTAAGSLAAGLAKAPGVLEQLLLCVHAMSTELKAVKEENAALTEKVNQLQNTSAALDTRAASLEERASPVEERLLKSEAYSGRATSILTGVPECPEEDTVAVVTEVIREVLPDFTSDRISTAHRNRQRDTSKPRSITVVFSKIKDKDCFSDFRRQAPLRKRKVGAYHYTPPAVLRRKRELEGCPGVARVYFDGPTKMFSVKGHDGVVRRNITTVAEAMAVF